MRRRRRRRPRHLDQTFILNKEVIRHVRQRQRRRRRGGGSVHIQLALIFNMEVWRHVRQRWRLRRGGGSAQSQLAVQQIDTFDSRDTFGSGGGGHGQEH